jgi:hypothetical protein
MPLIWKRLGIFFTTFFSSVEKKQGLFIGFIIKYFATNSE